MKNPLVSIIIATFNRANYIGKTLESLLAQSYTHYEIIIVDDWGTDSTKEVLAPFLEKGNIYFLKRTTEHLKGCPGSRNYGLTRARGEYIWFFDDDDIAHPELLKNCVENLENQRYDFCRFERTVFYDLEQITFETGLQSRKKEVSKGNLRQLIVGELPFNSCQVIWRRTCLGSDKFKEDIVYADDWELYSRLLAKGLMGISIDNVLLFARKHPGSATYEYKNKNKRICRSVIKANVSVINIAAEENIIDEQLFKFFLRQALFFKSQIILKHLLDKMNFDSFTRKKYEIGYFLYPVIKPFFKVKSKLCRI